MTDEVMIWRIGKIGLTFSMATLSLAPPRIYIFIKM